MSLQKVIEEASRRHAEQQQKEIRDKIVEHHAQVYGFAAAYDNVIMLAGYGAFFAIWAGMQSQLTALARALTAGLIGLSLVFYVIWHLIEMILRQKHEFRRSRTFSFYKDPDKFNDEWERMEREETVLAYRIYRWTWLPIFSTSVVFGLTGGLVLAYNCFAIYFGWPQTAG